VASADQAVISTGYTSVGCLLAAALPAIAGSHPTPTAIPGGASLATLF